MNAQAKEPKAKRKYTKRQQPGTPKTGARQGTVTDNGYKRTVRIGAHATVRQSIDLDTGQWGKAAIDVSITGTATPGIAQMLSEDLKTAATVAATWNQERAGKNGR